MCLFYCYRWSESWEGAVRGETKGLTQRTVQGRGGVENQVWVHSTVFSEQKSVESSLMRCLKLSSLRSWSFTQDKHLNHPASLSACEQTARSDIFSYQTGSSLRVKAQCHLTGGRVLQKPPRCHFKADWPSAAERRLNPCFRGRRLMTHADLSLTLRGAAIIFKLFWI